MAVSTALMRRPCTALATTWRRSKRRIVHQCDGCGLWEHQCVCGTGALSLGHELARRREERWHQRLWDAFVRVFEQRSSCHLRLVDPEDD